jgi:hypothetical protein
MQEINYTESALRSSSLYRKLKFSDLWTVIKKITGFVILEVIEIIAFRFYIINAVEVDIPTFIFCTVLVVVFSAVTAVSTRKTVRQNAQNSKRLNRLSYIDFVALEDEILQTGKFYKTFYMLEEYMYIPKARLLIKYADIAEFKSIIQKSIYGVRCGVKVEITDPDDVKYECSVGKWKLFLRDEDEFFEYLRFKKAKSTENNTNRFTEV